MTNVVDDGKHAVRAVAAAPLKSVLPARSRLATRPARSGKGGSMDVDIGTGFATRVQGRLDRLNLSPDEASRQAGLSVGFVGLLLEGQRAAPRGQRLVKLAEVLSVSVAYLVGLDPDAPVPPEYLEEDQGALGLLAGDEEALLRAYRRLDMSSKAALLQVVLKMSPEPVTEERKPREGRSVRG
jgi:transcriptional regulator with XRE-family HTH domain